MEIGFVSEYRRLRMGAYRQTTAWLERHETVKMTFVALGFALLTGVLAQVQIVTPLTPVPYTLQVLGIAFSGGLLGRKWGTISAGMYVVLGILGLPVYAGQLNGFHSFDFMSGWALFTTAAGASSLSVGYIPGFVLQAWAVGWVVDRRREQRNDGLLAFSTVAIAGLILFGLLDVFVYFQKYRELYEASTNELSRAWFAVLSLGLLALVGAFAWLAYTTKARRERIELFMGNVVGLLLLYAAGALGFHAVWQHLGFGPLDGMTLLRYTVLPFIPADITKVILAIGVLTLVRPTDAELGRAVAPEAPR